jgi:hypothetical protein
MVVKIISADNIVVEFGKNEVPRVPYITDIIEDEDADIEIPIIGIESRALKIVKELLELQTAHGLPFKCEPTEIQKHGTTIKCLPIHTNDPWEGKAPYLEYLKTLTAEECTAAFIAADYLKCYDVRTCISYIIAQRQLDFDSEMNRAIKTHFKDYYTKVYLKCVS